MAAPVAALGPPSRFSPVFSRVPSLRRPQAGKYPPQMLSLPHGPAPPPGMPKRSAPGFHPTPAYWVASPRRRTAASQDLLVAGPLWLGPVGWRASGNPVLKGPWVLPGRSPNQFSGWNGSPCAPSFLFYLQGWRPDYIATRHWAGGSGARPHPSHSSAATGLGSSPLPAESCASGGPGLPLRLALRSRPGASWPALHPWPCPSCSSPTGAS